MERSVWMRCDACKKELDIRAVAEMVSRTLDQIAAGLAKWIRALENTAFWARFQDSKN